MFAKLVHVAIFFVLFVDEPVPKHPDLADKVLAYALYASWGDLVEADPRCKRYANWIITAVRSCREKRISVTTAVARIQKHQRDYDRVLGEGVI